MTMPKGHAVHDRHPRIAAVSLRVLEEGGRVAREGDRWFLAAVAGAQRCRSWVRVGLGAIGSRLWAPPQRLGAAWAERRAPGARLRRVLKREVSRSKVEISTDDAEVFSDGVARLVELVTSGTVGIHDITFEVADEGENRAAANEPESDEPQSKSTKK